MINCIVSDKEAGLGVYSGIITVLWLMCVVIHQGFVGRLKKLTSQQIVYGIRTRLFVLAFLLAFAIILFILALYSCWGGKGVETITLVWIPVTVYVTQRLPRDIELVSIARRGYEILKAVDHINEKNKTSSETAPICVSTSTHSAAINLSKLDGVELTKASISFACACSMSTIGGREAWESLENIEKPDWNTHLPQLEMGVEAVELVQPGAKRWHEMGRIARMLVHAALASSPANELLAAYYRAIWIDKAKPSSFAAQPSMYYRAPSSSRPCW